MPCILMSAITQPFSWVPFEQLKAQGSMSTHILQPAKASGTSGPENAVLLGHKKGEGLSSKHAWRLSWWVMEYRDNGPVLKRIISFGWMIHMFVLTLSYPILHTLDRFSQTYITVVLLTGQMDMSHLTTGPDMILSTAHVRQPKQANPRVLPVWKVYVKSLPWNGW